VGTEPLYDVVPFGKAEEHQISVTTRRENNQVSYEDLRKDTSLLLPKVLDNLEKLLLETYLQ
jgi:hypothetical protein